MASRRNLTRYLEVGGFGLLVLTTVVLTQNCGGGNRPGTGNLFSTSSLDFRKLFAAQPFRAGISHVAGKYRFTNGNYLIEGAQSISALGSQSIFVYLEPDYDINYPDNQAGLWPTNRPQSMAQLADTAPYKQLFSMNFTTYILTAYSFSQGDQVINHADDPVVLQNEENEFYELTKYLMAKYQGTGKTFVLKNWEGDWIGLFNYDATVDLTAARADAMVKWFSARQRGINRARAEYFLVRGVAVLGAVEVNRVMDYVNNGMKRVIDQVVPRVGADLVTYSAYDSCAGQQGTDKATTEASLTQALLAIDRLAPDPLALGKKRIIISEFGFYENEYTTDPTMPVWRAEAILEASKNFGIFGAYFWQLYDNECYDSTGQVLTVNALPFGNPLRPTNNRCHGLWTIRPDGSQDAAVPTFQKYF